MQFKNVVIQSLAAIDAPIKLTSAEIGKRLRPAMERLGLRPGLIEEISGIKTRGFWNNGTQPSDAATMAAEKAIDDAGIGNTCLYRAFALALFVHQHPVAEPPRTGCQPDE